MRNSDKIRMKPPSKRAADRLYHILYWPVWFFFSIFHPVRVIGRENLPEGAAVIACNHNSLADPLMAIFACGYRNPIRIMAKEELFHIPLLGWLLIKVGMFGVNRGQSDISAVKRALKVLRDGCKLFLFPEGTRVKAGEDGDSSAKTGAVLFASRSSVQLIPMFIPRKKRWFRPTTVVIGEAYYPALPDRRTAEDLQRCSDELLERIYGLEGQKP